MTANRSKWHSRDGHPKQYRRLIYSAARFESLWIWSLVAALVGVPLVAVAASAPKLPRGFASQRFAPVVSLRGLSESDWQALQRYIHWKTLAEPQGPSPGGDHRSYIDRVRVLALAGIGPRFDFIIYRHAPSEAAAHDHLLVFRRVGDDYRALAFSCVGTLPRKVGQVAAAVAAGRCREETGPEETD